MGIRFSNGNGNYVFTEPTLSFPRLPMGGVLRFVRDLLPGLVREARPTFEKFRDVHRAYGKGELKYTQWLKKIRVGTKGWKRVVADAVRAEEEDKNR